MTEFNLERLKNGENIVKKLAGLRPETSLSFMLTEEEVAAVKEIIRLTSENMPGNMHKMREAALETLTSMTGYDITDARNVNLTEYELKALAKVEELIEKELEN